MRMVFAAFRNVVIAVVALALLIFVGIGGDFFAALPGFLINQLRGDPPPPFEELCAEFEEMITEIDNREVAPDSEASVARCERGRAIRRAPSLNGSSAIARRDHMRSRQAG